PQKDHQNLFVALSILRQRGWPVKCILVGRGLNHSNELLAENLRRLKLEDCVELASTRNDIHRLMNAFAIHVLPSSSGEGFPNVVAEAMACGVPCVVTDVGEAAGIVEDTGRLISPKDLEALANSIEIVMRQFREPDRLSCFCDRY